MGNPRSFTTKFNANNAAFERILRRSKCMSEKKRKAAMARAAALPNRLKPGPYAAKRAAEGRAHG